MISFSRIYFTCILLVISSANLSRQMSPRLNTLEKAESKDIGRMLAELEALSDGEARRSVTDERLKGGNSYARS
jgi:hypothetical protein